MFCPHIIKGTITAAKQALSNIDRSSVKAIGVSGQQHGMVVLDKDDNVLRPAKLWCDTESAGEAAELSEKLGYTVVGSITSSVSFLRCMHGCGTEG